jgi:prepilin-type N-terminal cleavage/methylation domain-containing protein
MKKLSSQIGFTLIESVMVIILLGIIGSVISSIYIQGLSARMTAQNVSDSVWQGQVALERMIRDIRLVRSANDITTMTATNFVFTNMSGQSINYAISGTTLTLNGNILADGIKSLAFAYKTNANATASQASLNTAYVKITLDIEENAKTNSYYTITTSVYLRDLSS